MTEPVALAGPADDAGVPGWWKRLGLPGLIDVHVHFMPENVQRAVWSYFDDAGPKLGRAWPIRYRGPVPERVERLRTLGVRRFGALNYAHKPGMAGYLNDWSAGFAAEVPEVIASATFFPEPGAAAEVGRRIEAGAEVFKVHAQVGEFDLTDPLLADSWGLLAEAGTPVVVHIGSGPVGNAFTGPEPLAALLRQHPRLRVIVAHMGAPEYADFLALAERYSRVHLDTTMVFTEFFDQESAYPAELLPRLAALTDRVLLGSDFPSIPHPYAAQVAGLARTAERHPGLGEEWLRAVCWENPVRLFGVEGSGRGREQIGVGAG